jgi:DNA-binding transcriptional LysR family regulator
MLTLPNFERLKIFHLVFMNRSIQKAADFSNVTRSAVSQSIKKLESEIGNKLFIRDAKNFTPTPEGEELFRTIDPFVSELNLALQRLDSGSNSPAGVIRIGAPMDLGSNQLTFTINKFRKLYPEIKFELHLGVPIKQLEMLISGKLDLAFIDNGDIHAESFPVSIQPYLKEEFVLVGSTSSFKKHKLTTASYEALIEIPIIDYLPHAPVTRMWYKHHFNKVPQKLNLVFSAESVQAVLNSILADGGFGIVPYRLIANKYESLKVVETKRGRFINQIVIARRLGERANFKEKEFIKFCREEIALKN